MSTCYLDPNPEFKPAAKLISAITNDVKASVTTTSDHEYLSGTIIRFVIPQACGMTELDKMVGTIEVTGSNTFLVDIDTSSFDVFAVPLDNLVDPVNGISPHYNTCAMVVPIGESSDMLNAAVRNIL